MNLIYPPIFDEDDANAAPIVVVEESEEPVNVVLAFHASPKPDNESVTWVLHDEIISLMAGDEVKEISVSRDPMKTRWSNAI